MRSRFALLPLVLLGAVLACAVGADTPDPAALVASRCVAAIARSKTAKTSGSPLDDFTTMLDAAGKIGSGVFQGNLRFPGAYDECRAIDSSAYGWATLKVQIPGAPSAPMVGLCVPEACSEQPGVVLASAEAELLKRLLPILPPSMRTNSTVPVDPSALVSKWEVVPRQRNLNGWGVLCIVIMAALLALSVAGAVVTSGGVPGCCELRFAKKSKKGRGKGRGHGNALIDVIRCFSLTENLATLCNLEQRFPQTAALEGMRVLSMQWVVIGHTVMTLVGGAGAPVVDNMVHMFVDVVKRFTMQPVVNATVSVDTFFTISGFLLAYVSMRKLRKLAATNPTPLQYAGAVLLFVVHRWLRIVPVLGVVMLASAQLVPSVGDGPFWAGRALGKSCRKWWWTNLLFINNLHPSELEDECVGQSWYLANDMQFFVLGVVCLVLFVAVPFLRRHPAVRYALLGLLAAASVVARMVVTHEYSLWPMGQMWGPETHEGVPYNTDVAPSDLGHSTTIKGRMYVRPWYRVSTYIVGVIAGMILDEVDQAARRAKTAAAKAKASSEAASSLTVALLESGDAAHQPAVSTGADAAAASFVALGDGADEEGAEGEDEGQDSAMLVRATSSGVGTMEYVPLSPGQEAQLRAADARAAAQRLEALAASAVQGGSRANATAWGKADAESEAEEQEEEGQEQEAPARRCTILAEGEALWYAGAVVALGVMAYLLFGLHGSYHGHHTGMAFNVAYKGLNRVVWSVAVAYFILACAFGRLKLVHRLLSLPVFLPLSKLSYSCYLIHITILQVSTGVDRVLLHYTDYSLISLYVGTMLLTYAGAAALFVLVEVPAARLEALVLPRV